MPLVDQGIAIVAGQGSLPEKLAKKITQNTQRCVIVQFPNVELDWAHEYDCVPAQFEKPKALFKTLKALGINKIVFAGGMKRPKLNPLKFDMTLLKLTPTLMPAMKSGDNTTLELITTIFEDHGFEIVSAQDILPELLVQTGILTVKAPSDADKKDVTRGAQIISAMAVADVGQACVVAQGLCLGMETIQGSDALLNWVGQSADKFKHDPNGGQGVFVKLPKLGQDLRVDLPTIGLDTIQAVSNAGLAGIVVQENGVLFLDQSDCIALADKLGLFIWVKEA